MTPHRPLLVLAVAGLALAGCSTTPPGSGSSSGSGSAAAATKGSITSATGSADDLAVTDQAAVSSAAQGKLIGIICATQATEYHKNLCEGAKAKAEELGFTAEIFDAREDAAREIEGFEGFLSKGAVAIIEDSLGADAITSQVAQAVAKNVLVVQVAGRTLAGNGAITVAVSDAEIAEQQGKAAGEYAASKFGGKPVQTAVLDYPDLPALVKRADDIQAAMIAAYPQTTVVGRYLGGTADNGQKSLETALQAKPGIQAVVGINDAGSLGAYQALKAAGKTADDTFVFGIDCDPQAVALIDQGTMYKGCVDTNPKGTGELAVQAVARYLTGAAVPGTIEVPVSVYTGK